MRAQFLDSSSPGQYRWTHSDLLFRFAWGRYTGTRLRTLIAVVGEPSRMLVGRGYFRKFSCPKGCQEGKPQSSQKTICFKKKAAHFSQRKCPAEINSIL